MLERVVYSRFKELYRTNQLFTMPTLLPGSLMAGLKAISIQLRESFRSRRPMSLITSAWIPVRPSPTSARLLAAAAAALTSYR